MFGPAVQGDHHHVGLLARYVHFATFYTSVFSEQVSVSVNVQRFTSLSLVERKAQ